MIQEPQTDYEGLARKLLDAVQSGDVSLEDARPRLTALRDRLRPPPPTLNPANGDTYDTSAFTNATADFGPAKSPPQGNPATGYAFAGAESANQPLASLEQLPAQASGFIRRIFTNETQDEAVQAIRNESLSLPIIGDIMNAEHFTKEAERAKAGYEQNMPADLKGGLGEHIVRAGAQLPGMAIQAVAAPESLGPTFAAQAVSDSLKAGDAPGHTLERGLTGYLSALGPTAMVQPGGNAVGSGAAMALVTGAQGILDALDAQDPVKADELRKQMVAMGLIGAAGHAMAGGKAEEKPAKVEIDATEYQAAVAKAAADVGIPIPEKPVEATPEPQPLKQEPVAAQEVAAVDSNKTAEQEVIGIANDPVEAQRAEAGMEPAEHGPFKSDESVHAAAVEKMQADSGYGERLVKDLTDKPRPPTTEETAALSLEVTRLANERDIAQIEYEKEQTPDTQARVDKAQVDYDRATNTATLVGTEASQAFRLRQWLLQRDYSLAAIQRRAKIEAGGEVSPEIETRLADLAKRVADTEKAFNDYMAGEPARQSEAGAQKNLKPTVREYIKTQADSARARMKARLRTPHANIDPQAFIDLAVIGADHIANGVSEFGAWSKKMLDEFPEIGENLQHVYEKAQQFFSESPKSKSYLQAFKTRTKNATAKLEEQLTTGDVTPKKRNKLVLDDEAIKLKAEHEFAKQNVQRAYLELRQKNRTKRQIAADAAREILDLPKAIWSSYDLSAVFRQGGFFTIGHPIQSIGHVKQMLKAASSDRAAREIDVKLRSRPGAAFGEMSGLDLTHTGDVLGTHEEAIRSRLSDKIPGIPMSNRAFTTYLNVQRAAMFDEMVRSIPGEVSVEQGKAIANAVNVGSGRGNPGRYAAAVNGLSTVLWAPRLLLSRFQLLAGQPFYGGDVHTRKAVAKEYARFLIGMGTIYTMGALLGGKEEKDPRSVDAGKIKFGDTRIDPLLGLVQVTRLLSEVSTGERKDSRGRVVPIRGNVPYGQPDASDVVLDFARTKLTPLLGLSLDVASGKTVTGEKTTPEWVGKQAIPLSLRDIYDAMRDQGVAKGAAISVLSVFGMGLQTYGQHR